MFSAIRAHAAAHNQRHSEFEARTLIDVGAQLKRVYRRFAVIIGHIDEL